MLDPLPDLTGTADTSGVHKLDFATFVAYDCTVDVAGSTGNVGYDCLLLLGQGIKQIRLADVRTA